MNAMNDNDAINDDDRPELEDLLKQVSLPESSAKLDRRMDALLMPRSPRNWIGPLAGFAAGVAFTTMVLPALSAKGTLPEGSALRRTAAIPVSTFPTQSAPTAPAAPVLAEPREVVDYVDGEINGVPVRLQRTRSELDLWQRDHSSEVDHAQVTLTDITTLQPVESY